MIFSLCVISIGDIFNGVDTEQRTRWKALETSAYLILPTGSDGKSKFSQVVSNLAALWEERAISIGLTKGSTELEPAFAKGAITPELVIEAHERGLIFQKTEKEEADGKVKKTEPVQETKKVAQAEKEKEELWYKLTKATTELGLQVITSSRDARWLKVKEFLNLGAEDTFLININEPPTFKEAQPKKRNEINISTRSLLGMMMFLSGVVDIPRKHDRFFTDEGTKKEENALLRVRESARRPSHRLAVRYRDHWFYIKDRDVSSRVTLALLDELFVLRAGPVQAPVLTLPIGAR